MKFNPVNTYRIQFHKGFTFQDFKNIVPYLKTLGVKTIYASPIFAATPGSTHGYDIIDPHRINPEIGTLEELREISGLLKSNDMSWIQDIVPNHMAFHPENLWLTDVLEQGTGSHYIDYFDIDLSNESKLMVPFLGAPVEEVIKNDELKLKRKEDQLQFVYYDNTYPLNNESYDLVFRYKGVLQEDIIELLNKNRQGKQVNVSNNENGLLDDLIGRISNDPDFLTKLHDIQHYRLCHWQETNHKINFRRFFTINGLISLNMQHQKVFEDYHQLIIQLVNQGVFQGLRIDHVDGMYDPVSYLENLRNVIGDQVYLVIEKILELDEELPEKWPIEGTTGYEFLALTNNLFSYSENRDKLTAYFHNLTGDNRTVEERTKEKKRNILHNRLAGDLDNLHNLLINSDLIDEPGEKIREALAVFLIEFPVYRFYGNTFPLDAKEDNALNRLFQRLRKNHPALSNELNQLENVLVNTQRKDQPYNEKAAHLYKRLMQYTGPVMAKGVEDTLMYTYSRFIGHNEVGDNPSFLGISVGEFHNRMKERQKKWPLAMNTTSTHDTKRGEDVRMRLNVITALSDEWISLTEEWRKANESLKQNNTPDANDEYFLYQTIMGTFPMPGMDHDDFDDRLRNYITKALREGKRHTNWTDPDDAYEQDTIEFANKLLHKDSDFLKSFIPFHQKVADFGIINSLAQVILKYTCPGIPDLYQGCELWDLSFVDPDNRRPVDYSTRKSFLKDITKEKRALKEYWNERYNGKIKLWLTHILLNERSKNPDLFSKGVYTPLEVNGTHANHLIAFSRSYYGQDYTMICPKSLAYVGSIQNNSPERINWEDTHVYLPGNLVWTDIIRDRTLEINDKILVEKLFEDLPISVLKNGK